MKEKFSEFQCPNCGWWPVNGFRSGNLIKMGAAEVSEWKSKEFGVEALDWEETWKCSQCGTIWTFTNSNC